MRAGHSYHMGEDTIVHALLHCEVLTSLRSKYNKKYIQLIETERNKIQQFYNIVNNVQKLESYL